MSLVDEVMQLLSRSRAIRDMKGSDSESLKRFEAYMRHYGRMARNELDRRGVRPFSLAGKVEISVTEE